MDLSAEKLNGTLLVRIADARIDAAVAIQFKDTMRSVVDPACPRTVIDMANVEFLDSSGLGAIVSALKQTPTGHTLELAALTPPVMRVFQLTRMDTVFQLHETVADAIEAQSDAA